MTKHCGLGKLFTFLLAALFSLTLAAPQSRADDIAIGNGVLTLCWEGISSPCDFAGDQPNVTFTDVNGKDQISIHIQSGGADTNKDLDSPLLVIFGVPVQNLLYPFNVPSGGNDPFGGPINPPVPGVIDSVGLWPQYDPDTGDLYVGPVPGQGGGGTSCCPPLGAPVPPVDLGPGTLPTAANLHYLGGLYTGGTAPFTAQGQIFGPDSDQLFDDFLDFSGIGGGSDTVFPQWAKEMFDTPMYLAKAGYLDSPDGAGLLPDPNADPAAYAAALAFFEANLLGNHPDPCAINGNNVTLDPTKCVTGFYIWIYEVATSGLDGDGNPHTFGSGDTINIVTDGFPLGTIVSAYGVQQGCIIDEDKHGNPIPPQVNDTGGCVLAPPDSKKAILMAVPGLCTPGDPTCDPTTGVPEPTSMLLLGTGLLAIGRQWRKKQQDRKKVEKQSVT